jgi:hypothetical protein
MSNHRPMVRAIDLLDAGSGDRLMAPTNAFDPR